MWRGRPRNVASYNASAGYQERIAINMYDTAVIDLDKAWPGGVFDLFGCANIGNYFMTNFVLGIPIGQVIPRRQCFWVRIGMQHLAAPLRR